MMGSTLEKGYQRLPSQARVNKLSRDLMNQKVDLTTALLLNLRHFDESVHIVRTNDGATFLRLADDYLWEVDGQHRCEAIKRVLDDNHDRFKDYTIPCNCSELGGSEHLTARGEGVKAPGAPGTEEGSERHLGVGALVRAGAAADLPAGHQVP